MSSKPFLINSIIGNGLMLATLGKNSEIYRIFWPHIDNFQHLQSSFAGINAGEGTWWFVDGGKWHYEQSYIPDTNIVTTILTNGEKQLQVEVTDFVVSEKDILVRHYEVVNNSEHSLPIRFLYYAAFHFQNSPFENGVLYSKDYDALIHYRHGYHFAVGADKASSGYQCGANALEDGHDGYLGGAAINMSPEGCQVWDFGLVEGKAKVELTVYLCPGYSVAESGQWLAEARSKGYRKLYEDTAGYWAQFLSQGRPVTIVGGDIGQLYRRSLLVCGLLSDHENGGIIAAPELDEQYVKSGGYGYCWPRDCVFVADAMARAGYGDFARRFYDWARQTQLPDGQWFQRYDTEGNIGPGWGNQIDQTGAVLWGIWQYYILYEDKVLIKDIWSVIFQGASFLCSFIDGETGLPLPSFDLWEERQGEHAYSSAAVYGGLLGSAEIARSLGYAAEANRWQQTAMGIAKGIEQHLWDPDKNCFIRTIKKIVGHGEYEHHKHTGQKVFAGRREKDYDVFQIWKDDLIDSSLLGLVYPFEVLPPADSRVKSMVESIERALTCPRTGGLKRYEHDHYIGGNPWINTTLWLAIYWIRARQPERAKHLIRWAVEHQTEMGLLPEQVDQHTGNPAWIIPLTWSHAIFVLAVLEYIDSGLEESL